MSKNLTIFVTFDTKTRFTEDRVVETTTPPAGWTARYVAIAPEGYPVPAGFEHIIKNDHSRTIVEMNNRVYDHDSHMVCVLTNTAKFNDGDFAKYVEALDQSEAIFAYCDSVKVTEFGTPLRHLFMPPVNRTLFNILDPLARGGLMHIKRMAQLVDGEYGAFDVDGDMITMSGNLSTALAHGTNYLMYVEGVSFSWRDPSEELPTERWDWRSHCLPYSTHQVLENSNRGYCRTRVTGSYGLPSLTAVFANGIPRIRLVVRNVSTQNQLSRVLNWVSLDMLRQLYDCQLLAHNHIQYPHPFTITYADASTQVDAIDVMLRETSAVYTLILDAERIPTTTLYEILADGVLTMMLGRNNVVGFRSFVDDSAATRIGWEIDKERQRLIPIISKDGTMPSRVGPFGIFNLQHNISVANSDLLLVRNMAHMPQLDNTMPNLFLHNLCIQQPGKVAYSPVTICDGTTPKAGSIPMDEYARMMENATIESSFRYYTNRFLFKEDHQ